MARKTRNRQYRDDLRSLANLAENIDRTASSTESPSVEDAQSPSSEGGK